MSPDPKTVAFIVDQAHAAGDVYAKPMFGEYGIHCRGGMVAMACDDQLFFKPTASESAFARQAEEPVPYPGAKPCLPIGADLWYGGDWLAELFRISAAELPLSKPKSPQTSKRTPTV